MQTPVSALPSSSYLSNDSESVAPPSNKFQDGTGSTCSSQVAEPSAAMNQDNGEDKVIMASISVTSAASKSLLNRFKPKNRVKIVLMPQSEYAKYFAKDQASNYISTEPQSEWTEAELDQAYGKYKSSLPRAPMRDEAASRGVRSVGATGGWAMS